MSKDNMLPENIHKTIKAKRIELDMSQATLAEKADISTTFVSDIENGKRNISLKTFYSIAKALGMNIEDFFSKQEEKEKSKKEMISEITNTISSLSYEKVNALYNVFKYLKK